jgi:cysteine-rich repeat protein
VEERCVCQRGHLAGQYCTEIVGCTVINRTLTEDVCVSCNATLNFELVNDRCQCLPNSELIIDRCEDICGDGFVTNQECDDGNRLDLDGCSPICRVEDKYVCLGGTALTPSVCRIVSKINVTLAEAKREPRKNRLVAVFSINPPTRLLQFVNLSASLHFSASDFLELAEVTATHESITVKFDYFRDVP